MKAPPAASADPVGGSAALGGGGGAAVAAKPLLLIFSAKPFRTFSMLVPSSLPYKAEGKAEEPRILLLSSGERIAEVRMPPPPPPPPPTPLSCCPVKKVSMESMTDVA